MDFLPQMKSRNKSKRKRSEDLQLKVVYISSPMKVKTSASRFRTLVQELTGRDSDISRFMDTNSTETANFEILPDNYRVSNSMTINDKNNQHHLSSFPSFPLEDPHRDSLTSSDSVLEDSVLEQPPSFGDVFSNEHYYQGLLTSDLFSSNSELDVLGSYDAL